MFDSSTEIDIRIKNFRCFTDECPAHIVVKDGFTSFVGMNNSGKSSLLKFFYEFRNLFANITEENDYFRNAIAGINNFVLTDATKDPEEMFYNNNNRDILVEIATNYNPTPIRKTEGLLPGKIVFQLIRGQNQCYPHLYYGGKDINPVKTSSVARLAPGHIKIGETLFNLEPYFTAFHLLSKMIYIGPFRNAVNIGGKQNYYDMVIGQQFISMWDNYKSGLSKNTTNAALKLTEDIKSIFGFKNLEINASTDNQTLHVIVDGKPYRLEELGSGLAQFIVILSNIAIQKPSWVLIDEPELNLHPSLQMDFLTSLASYASNGIIFSTHNVGLARAASERIYSFRLNQANQIIVGDFENLPDLTEFLGELSYSLYHDLGYNKIVLVEGSTEIKTIQQFLRMYQKDHKIILLSLGGSDLINPKSEFELNEIKRITTDVHVVIDSERDSIGAPLSIERQQFSEICQKLNIRCHVLKYRAIENYLSDKAVKAIKGDKFKSLTPYQKLNDISPTWGKQENWRIAREMNRQEVENTDLGEFLNSL